MSGAGRRGKPAGGARLPQLELECMQVLWQMPPQEGATVAAVRAALPRPLAYTTVLTVLDRMAAKGVVARRKAGRAFVYTPALGLEAARRDALRHLLTHLFAGDRHALLRHLGALGAGVESPSPRARASAEKKSAPRPPKARAARPAETRFRPAHMDDSLL